tara:strand:+ start:12632 stop:13228 length:597 start_codon:yes stop_codon:yes gene_type:complete
MADNKIIRIDWDDRMVTNAQNKAKKLGKIKNSILRGGGNAAGYLGEEAVASYIGAEITSCDEGSGKYNFDITTRDERKVEVKTKRRTVSCIDDDGNDRGFYEVSIAKTSVHQRPELYIFVNIHFDDYRKDENGVARYYGIRNIEILGQMEPEDYFAEARFVPKGELDPSNNFVAHADMYNLPISELESLDDSLLPQEQ